MTFRHTRGSAESQEFLLSCSGAEFCFHVLKSMTYSFSCRKINERKSEFIHHRVGDRECGLFNHYIMFTLVLVWQCEAGDLESKTINQNSSKGSRPPCWGPVVVSVLRSAPFLHLVVFSFPSESTSFTRRRRSEDERSVWNKDVLQSVLWLCSSFSVPHSHTFCRFCCHINASLSPSLSLSRLPSEQISTISPPREKTNTDNPGCTAGVWRRISQLF